MLRTLSLFLTIPLASSLLADPARSQTTVPGGDVSGTWTLAGSPFRIEGDIAVPAGSSLVIEPGVEVFFQSWFELAVHGALHAVGTVDAPVRFTATPPGPGEPGWRGIRFLAGSQPSELAWFVLENARSAAGPPYDDRGGGIYVEQSSPVIRDGVLRNNRSTRAGGAIYCDGGSPVIARNRIHENLVGYLASGSGGAIACVGASPVIDGNVIRDNEVGAFGGFVLAVGRGGGVSLVDCQATLRNNVIAGNRVHAEGNLGTRAQGGGVYVQDSSGLGTQMTHDTVVGNSATVFASPGEGGGLYLDGDTLQVRNAILWDNAFSQIEGGAAAVSYSDVQGGYPGAGNIDADPLFVDGAEADLHLTATSPCRDAGDPVAPLTTDFEGDPRTASVPDMGADEFFRHLYATGVYAVGDVITVKLVGEPGTAPAVVAAGAGILDPPRPTPFGDLYLATPLRSRDLGTIPATGVLPLPLTVPANAPALLPSQALIGTRLTNLFVLRLETP